MVGLGESKRGVRVREHPLAEGDLIERLMTVHLHLSELRDGGGRQALATTPSLRTSRCYPP